MPRLLGPSPRASFSLNVYSLDQKIPFTSYFVCGGGARGRRFSFRDSRGVFPKAISISRYYFESTDRSARAAVKDEREKGGAAGGRSAGPR